MKNEYKIYARIARAERREVARQEREAEKRRLAREARGECGSGSEYTDSDDDGEDSDAERRRRIANAEKRFVGFKPPTVYDVAPEEMEAASSRPDVVDVDMQSDSVVPEDSGPVVVTEAAADEWAAWSADAPKTEAAVADDPYSRRMALSQQSQQQQPHQTIHLAAPAPPLPMSACASPSLAPAVPPSTYLGDTSSIPGLPPGIPMPPRPWYEQHAPSSAQPETSETGSASPMTVASAQSSAQPAGGVSLEEAQAKARAIAARLASLGKLGGGLPSSSASPYQTPSADEPIPGLGPPVERPTRGNAASSVDPKDFAKDLMAKYGWSKGQGLGATSQGMLNPLALSKDVTKGGKGKNKEDVIVQKVTGMANAKGRVVSDLKTEKEKAEREKYGEPTRIVCLTNMVGREDAGDEELVNDVCEYTRSTYAQPC